MNTKIKADRIKTLITITNIYPSRDNPDAAPFVHAIHSGLGQYFDESCVVKGMENNEKTVLSKTWKYLVLFHETYRALKRQNTLKIVYVHFPPLSGWPLLILSPFFPKNFLILNFHGNDLAPDKKLSWISRTVRNLVNLSLAGKANMILVPSLYFRQFAIKHLGDDVKYKVHVTPSGGIDEAFKPDTAYRTCEVLTFGFAGRLIEGKGILDVLKVCTELKKAGIKFRLNIFGNGPLATIVRTHVETGVVDCFQREGGRTELANFLQKVDILLFLSTRKGESLGLTALEAMAAGCFVIAYDSGAMREVVKPRINGKLIRPNSLHDLTCFLRQICAAKPLLARGSISDSVQKFRTEHVLSDLALVIKKEFANATD